MWRRAWRAAATASDGPSAVSRLLARDLYRSLVRATREHDARPEWKAMLLAPSTRVFSGNGWKDRYDVVVADPVARAVAALQKRALGGRSMYVPGSGEPWVDILRSERHAAADALASAAPTERAALVRRQTDLAFAVLRELANTKRHAAHYTAHNKDLARPFAPDYTFPAVPPQPVLFPVRVTDVKAAAAASATVTASATAPPTDDGSAASAAAAASASAAAPAAPVTTPFAVSGFDAVRPGCLLIAHPYVSVGASPRALSMTPANYWSQAVILVTHVEPAPSVFAANADPTDSANGNGNGNGGSGGGRGMSSYGGGAVEGVILNKPAREAQVKAEAFKECVPFFGGPVATHATSVLHNNSALPGAVRIVPGVCVGAGTRALEDSVRSGATDVQRIKLLAGRAEWAPGQLAGELALGWWLVASPFAPLSAPTAAATANGFAAAASVISALALTPPPKPLPNTAAGAAAARAALELPATDSTSAATEAGAGASSSSSSSSGSSSSSSSSSGSGATGALGLTGSMRSRMQSFGPSPVNLANANAMRWYSRTVWDSALNAMGGEYAAMTRLGTSAARTAGDSDDSDNSDSDSGGGGAQVVVVSPEEIEDALKRLK